MKKYWLSLFAVLFFLPGFTQERDSIRFGFSEYMVLVKANHPVVKQAGILVEQSEAQLRKARGAFDPKIESSYDRKQFKDTEYFDILNAGLKVPTWFGVELKAKYENNSGEFLNPQNKVPEDGLFAAGISIPVGEGLFINERMTSLKQAKAFIKQTRAEQELLLNEILYEAALTYFTWVRAYKMLELYNGFAENASIRVQGIDKSYRAGDKPAIDTLEARISLQSRNLELEQSRLNFLKAGLKLGTFLWTEDNEPLQLEEKVIPKTDNIEVPSLASGSDLSRMLEDHPKLRALDLKIDILKFERRLKANKLLPDLDVEYNFLTQQPEELNSLNYDEYKFGFKFSLPLFLRKERGELALSRLKLENAGYDLELENLKLRNKIIALHTQVESLENQYQQLQELVNNYRTMLLAEERKLELGESSVFLVNTRESNLLLATQKLYEMEYKLWGSKLELLKELAQLQSL